MTYQKKIISKKLVLGEGPHWDEKTQCLYFVDIFGYTVHKYDSKTGLNTYAKVSDNNEPISIIIPIKDETEKFLVTTGHSIATIVWDGVSETISDFKVLVTLEDCENLRLNDGKVSPSGILFAGTMRLKPDFINMDTCDGHLYSFKDLKPKKLLDGVSISNGLAWTSDEKVFYYNDSAKYRVDSFQYDKETTELSNRRTVFDFKENNLGDALPDGMTIDTDENLWVACYAGSQVINIDPRSGKLLRFVEFPAALFITSVAFGGPNFDDLYVTSAHGEIPHLQTKPEDGYTFLVTNIGARGFPAKAIQL